MKTLKQIMSTRSKKSKEQIEEFKNEMLNFKSKKLTTSEIKSAQYFKDVYGLDIYEYFKKKPKK